MHEVPQCAITDLDPSGFKFNEKVAQCDMWLICYPPRKPIALIKQNGFSVATDLTNGYTSRIAQLLDPAHRSRLAD